MAELPRALLRHRVTAEANLGAGGYEDAYGPAVTVPCFRDGEVRMTADGQLIDPVTLYCRLEWAEHLVPDSRVRWEGAAGNVEAFVQAVAEHSDGGLGAWQHLEVVLQ